MALAHLEEQHEWLTAKIRRDRDLIDRAEEFLDDKQYGWSRQVLNQFLMMLEKMKTQLYYEEHRHELLTWQIVEAREGRPTDIYSLPS